MIRVPFEVEVEVEVEVELELELVELFAAGCGRQHSATAAQVADGQN